ncbi:MAG: arginine--tRNA ligase, partial [Myxococcota bacterium]|nr:arginine--tRNA ligase [Myxococcota bacterium]
LGESAYNDALPDVVSSLKACGLSTDSEGASIIRFPEDTDPKSIANTVLVVQKQDGAFLYGTTDLATLEYRKKTWNPNRIIYVTDTRQQLHFRQVFHIWNRWRTLRGEEDIAEPALIHTWFGMLKLPEGAMSSRKGNVIRLIDLMDESVRRARMVTDAKSGHLSEDERKNIAEAVGLAAIRYSDLAQNPQTDVQFTWDKVLSLEGNTAPFLMYSYARGRGIQRKSGRAEHNMDSLMIHAPIARELVLLLLKFPVVVEMSQQNCKPNLLCDYLYTIADCFNRFYNLCPVLSAESEPIKNARLSLVECTLCILEKGLSLLGIEALDRM